MLELYVFDGRVDAPSDKSGSPLQANISNVVQ